MSTLATNLVACIALGVMAAEVHAEDITSTPYYINAPGTYTLTGNLQHVGSTAISIAASDVILDLGGYTLSGAGGTKGGYGYGVGVAPGASDVIIRNGTIAEFEIEVGVMLHGVTDCTISNVTVRECGGGIAMIDGGGHTIEDNTLDHNTHANISAMNSGGNLIEGNTCTGAAWGIRLGGSSSGNSLLGNTCIGLGGSNTTPIDLTDTDGNTLIGNNVTNGWIGIYGVNADANFIFSNLSTANASGMTLHGDFNAVLGNEVNGNAETGIAGGGTGNTLYANTCNGNGSGIYMNGAIGCTISDNTANDNVNDGIVVWTSGLRCRSNTIRRNTANNNGLNGVEVFGCVGNVVRQNTAIGNDAYGVALVEARYNRVEKNHASGSVFVDLVDDTCVGNIWARNIFTTSSGTCIE
jgi:parallel beta-helix repeat protein